MQTGEWWLQSRSSETCVNETGLMRQPVRGARGRGGSQRLQPVLEVRMNPDRHHQRRQSGI